MINTIHGISTPAENCTGPDKKENLSRSVPKKGTKAWKPKKGNQEEKLGDSRS